MRKLVFISMKKCIKFENVLFVIFIIITLIVTLKHEAWRDEAQSWLIAKNLSLFEMFNQLKYEGHPFLYYLIIMPFAKFGLPYKSINIISWIFGCLSTLIILYKLPLNKSLKVAIIFSAPMIYLYTAFGRSYSLLMFLICYLSLIYNHREKYPILYGISLLMITNTHILCFGFVLALLSLDFYDLMRKRNDKRLLKSIIIAVMGIIILLVQFIPSLNQLNSGVNGFANMSFFGRIKYFIIFPFHFGVILTNNYILGAIFIIFFFYFCLILISDNKIFYILVVSVLFFDFVHAFVYQLGFQHLPILIFILIFCYVCYCEKNNCFAKLKVCFLFVLLSTIPYSFMLVYNDCKYNWSNSLEMAKYIENNIASESKILCTNDARCTAIIPYLSSNYKFFSFYNEKKFSFVTWSSDRNLDRSCLDLTNLIQKYDYVIYVLEYCDLEVEELINNNKLKFLYKAQNNLNNIGIGENYTILKVVKE